MSEKNPQERDETQSPEEVATEQAPGDALDVLQRDLEAMEDKAKEHWDQFLRTQAELENLRRRAERDLENAHKYALERFAGELLPVKDSLEMGLDAAAGGEAEKIREGMELTLRMLTQVLEKFGIQEINPAGERFDPERHQAMTAQPTDECPPNTVLTVMQKGYLLNDRLLRPAMVMVSKAPE
ncbi:MAG: nucleotide exchange factor GrpE [Acidihalobacter sp.]|uniref:nucleotide exchange factor GrpE n=1 Tax=Acidihalobacter sp. TaxID=1872108 RepID=UPI00307FCBAC